MSKKILKKQEAQNKINFSGYRVESRWSSGEQEYSVLPDETELRIPDLEPDQSYRFRIQAINERGASPFSGIFHSEALVRVAITYCNRFPAILLN